MKPRTRVPLLVLLLASPLRAEEAPIAEQTVTCEVRDAAGAAVPAVVVFAADARTDKVVKVGVADGAGRVELVVPRRAHNFGLLTPTFGVERLIARGANRFVLVVRPMPRTPVADPPAADGVSIEGETAFVVRGKVVDEVGGGLGGVRVEAVRPGGALASTAVTGLAGDFALALPGGRYALRANAPGLRALKTEREAGKLTIVMAIAADVQRLDLTDGPVLSFRVQDSVDPEYYPPAKVLAWLRYAYNICPSAAPPTAHQRRITKKYWWLDVLREEPSSPAQRATFFADNCRPALTFGERSTAWRTENASGGFGPLP